MPRSLLLSFFFFSDPATPELYTLSLHDALPISTVSQFRAILGAANGGIAGEQPAGRREIKDRKSTRLNSSHGYISYAVFCLKKKNKNRKDTLNALRKCPDMQNRVLCLSHLQRTV